MRDRLARLLERPLVVRDNSSEALDAIVVLGAPLTRDGSLTPALEERVAAAAELFHAGGAPRIAATGGITRSPVRAEADAMAEALRAEGIPEAAILIERASRSTAENARLTAALLAPLGARRVWLVTQPFHGRRAARLFRDVGLEPHVWHIDGSLEYADRERAVRWLVREYASWARQLIGRRRA